MGTAPGKAKHETIRKLGRDVQEGTVNRGVDRNARSLAFARYYVSRVIDTLTGAAALFIFHALIRNSRRCALSWHPLVSWIPGSQYSSFFCGEGHRQGTR